MSSFSRRSGSWFGLLTELQSHVSLVLDTFKLANEVFHQVFLVNSTHIGTFLLDVLDNVNLPALWVQIGTRWIWPAAARAYLVDFDQLDLKRLDSRSGRSRWLCEANIRRLALCFKFMILMTAQVILVFIRGFGCCLRRGGGLRCLLESAHCLLRKSLSDHFEWHFDFILTLLTIYLLLSGDSCFVFICIFSISLQSCLVSRLFTLLFNRATILLSLQVD